MSLSVNNVVSVLQKNLQNLQPLDDCLIGQTKENKKKNRYKNIVPCKKAMWFFLGFFFCVYINTYSLQLTLLLFS